MQVPSTRGGLFLHLRVSAGEQGPELRRSPMCWIMPLTVGWKSSFMASQDIRSIPCEDHFTKFTLQG